MADIPNINDFPDEIPQATYFRVYRCQACPNAHIVLFDENDVPFAQFTVARNNVQHLLVETNRVFDEKWPKAEVIDFKKN